MTETDAKVIIALCLCNMNVSAVSRRLYFYRNNILYHINKVKRITGLNPLNFFDLIELHSIAREILGDEYENV